MATLEAGTTIKSRLKNLLRSPSIKLRRHKLGAKKEDIGSKVGSCVCDLDPVHLSLVMLVLWFFVFF